MRKILGVVGILVGVLALVVVSPGLSEAALLEGDATADDIFWVWDYSGSGTWDSGSWYPVGGWDDWTSAEYIYGNPAMGETVDLYFAVENLVPPSPSSSNPAGFLGSLETDTGVFQETGTNLLLTDTTHWGIVAYSNGWSGDPTFDPTLLSYGTPTSYGANNNSSTIWYSVNGGPISDIDGNAEWIWTENNFGAGMDNYAILHTSFSVTPEPGSLSLLGMGLLGMLGAGLRKKRR